MKIFNAICAVTLGLLTAISASTSQAEVTQANLCELEAKALGNERALQKSIDDEAKGQRNALREQDLRRELRKLKNENTLARMTLLSASITRVERQKPVIWAAKFARGQQAFRGFRVTLREFKGYNSYPYQFFMSAALQCDRAQPEILFSIFLTSVPNLKPIVVDNFSIELPASNLEPLRQDLQGINVGDQLLIDGELHLFFKSIPFSSAYFFLEPREEKALPPVSPQTKLVPGGPRYEPAPGGGVRILRADDEVKTIYSATITKISRAR